MKTFGCGIAAVVLFGAGCAFQRAQVAQDAQNKMVGLSKERVLQCMGAPAGRMAEGGSEVWTYNSGNGHTSVSSSTNSDTSLSAVRTGPFISGDASTSSFGTATATQRFCTVSVVMAEGRVSRVNYIGPTGGLLTSGEQCAFAVQNCVR